MKGSVAVRNPVGTPLANDCSSVTITSAAYVQLTASLGASCSAIEVQNTSAKAIKLAVGAAASEVDKYIVAPANQSLILPIEIAKGARVSAKALGADATTGFFIVNFLA